MFASKDVLSRQCPTSMTHIRPGTTVPIIYSNMPTFQAVPSLAPHRSLCRAHPQHKPYGEGATLDQEAAAKVH